MAQSFVRQQLKYRLTGATPLHRSLFNENLGQILKIYFLLQTQDSSDPVPNLKTGDFISSTNKVT